MEKLSLKKEHFNGANGLEELLEESVTSDRRKFMKKGALAASAMALASSWLANLNTAHAQTGMSDMDMIKAAFTLEQQAVNTYTAAAGLESGGAPIVSGAFLSVALTFREDHSIHAGEFASLITILGGTVPTSTTETTLTAFPPGPNSGLTNINGILRYALAVEIFAANLWFKNFKVASDIRVKRAFADLAPNEAAHAAILRAALKFIQAQPTDHDNSNPGRAVVPYASIVSDGPVF